MPVSFAENFLEGSETLSEERSNTMSLSRTGSLGRSGKLGVAFDPSVGPMDVDAPSKVECSFTCYLLSLPILANA